MNEGVSYHYSYKDNFFLIFPIAFTYEKRTDERYVEFFAPFWTQTGDKPVLYGGRRRYCGQ